MYIEYCRVRLYPAAVMMTSMFGSLFSPVYAADPPRPQEFVVTAYYSPVPNQCCYFRGSYEEEITFNGNGIRGADGTEVYPGMLAAPASYGFGSRIELPGFGVGTVHDRGGRIIEWGDDIHRIDVWMGVGETGLARAMAWGVRKVSGTVYPLGSEVMPAENFTLDNVSADTSLLSSLPKTDPLELLTLAKFENQDYAVRVLQNALKDLGYLEVAPNGQFGPATKQALSEFLTEQHLPGDGTAVDKITAAALTVALSIKQENLPDLAVGLEQGMSGPDVRQAQKLLRFLGFYRGRTNGIFDDTLKSAVIAFQRKNGIIQNESDTGAGRIGPATQAAILKSWKAQIVASKSQAVARKLDITQKVKAQELPKNFLAKGDTGKEVKLLQSFLIDAGYLGHKDVTGSYGSRTTVALTKYQLDRSIVSSADAKGAGVFGPATRLVVSQHLVEQKWQEVRAGK